MYSVAVGIAKLEFYNNLRKSADVAADGLTTVFPAGFVHLPKIDAEFIQQLCAEQLITRRDRNGFRSRMAKDAQNATRRSIVMCTPVPPHRRRAGSLRGTPLARTGAPARARSAARRAAIDSNQ